jgi:hypothetical protein
VLTGLIELRNLTLQRFDVIGRLGASSACREDIANRKGEQRERNTETAHCIPPAVSPTMGVSLWGRRGGAMTTAE